MKTWLAYVFAFMAIAAAVGGCTRDSKSSTARTSGGPEIRRLPEGLSLETAVALDAKTQAEGVAAQHAWIEKNLPGAHPAPAPKMNSDEEIISFGQETIQHNGKIYSVVHLRMPDGKPRDVYFDITSYFGK